MSRWLIVTVACTVAVAATLAPAQSKKKSAAKSSSEPVTPTYIVNSKAYKITTDVDKDLSKEIAAHMDAVFKEYNARFTDYGPPLKQQLPLYVYQTQEGYLRMLAAQGIDGSGSGGMFFGGNSLAAFIGEQGLDRMFHTLRHEGFHQFAHFRIGHDLPTWCNEGLAEYFGEAIMVKNKLAAGQVPVEKLALVQNVIKKNEHIPFSSLLNMSHREWNSKLAAGTAQLQYEQSWAIVHFLVHGDPLYQKAFAAYLMQISKGADSTTAFAKSFGADYKPFESAWKKYMLALQPNPEKAAAKRLQFLANGIQWLKKNGEEATSLEDLKKKLQARKFGMRYSYGHGTTITMTSEDDDNFRAPDSPSKKPTTLEWEPTASAEALPTLVVKGLKYTVRLTWRKNPEKGNTVAQVVYE